ATLGHPFLLNGRGLLPGFDELDVNGGYGHEQGQTALGDAVPDLLGIEGGKDLAYRPYPESAGDHVHNPVDMMQRQDFQDPIILGPSPGLDQTGNLCGNVLM